MLTFGSLFSGIGGFDLAFERAGMACKWQVEIDARCQDVLGRHWPEVERHSDIRECGKHNLEPVDLVCGGFPCQDLSVAGRRAGLAGERSGLWFEFHRVLTELEPRWVVIENVPGLLSSNGGRDFATVIRGLVDLRYGVCWRVLDAQYFGVAQRRRRVFIVGHLGDGRAAEVLFEREGVPGDTPPSRETGQGVAAYTPGGFGEYRQGVGALRANGGDLGGGSETFVAYNIQHNDGGEHKRKDRPNGGLYVKETEQALTVGTTDMTAVCFEPRYYTRDNKTGGMPNEAADITNCHKAGDSAAVIAWHENKQGNLTPSDHAKALRSGASHSYQGVGVRRLTPVECERLQGFPDGWTDGQADSARYRQLGNAVAVPVVEWIGQRIMEAC